MISFLLSILYGALAGWISSRIMKTTGGTLRNIITGIVGGMIIPPILTMLVELPI